MRTFWIVLLLVVAGCGLAIFSAEKPSEGSQALQTSGPARSPDVAPQVEATTIQTPPPAATEIVTSAAEDISETAEVAQSDVEGSAPVVEEAESEIAESTEEATTETATSEEVSELAIVDLTAEDIAEAIAEESGATTPAPVEEAATESPSGWDALTPQTPTAPTAETTETPATAEETAAPYVVEHLAVTELEEGKIQIGESITILGRGTKEEPFILPWDFLVSIRQAYSPREGRKEIPNHFAYFEGKYVSIAGYLQFPLANPEPTECLIMLNQWDGCCIGVPPTPYDAIEVALSIPATQAEKFAVEGRIVGKLDIDPYLVGNWLIGLYLLGDATVDVSGSRSAEEVYGNTPSQMMPGQ